ncbi:MAG: hypothetical protein ACR2IT_02355 [Pirellulales bacterium]
MPPWLTAAFPSDAELSVPAILVRLGASIVLGGIVAVVYRGTRHDREAGPDLSQTLLLLTLVIAMITLAVGGNVARAFSLASSLDGLQTRRIETLTKPPGTEFTYHGILKPGADTRDLVRRLRGSPGVTGVDLRLGDPSRG